MNAKETSMTAPQIDQRALRDALGAFATGVTIVTTRDADGQPRGLTANSFVSISLDPPLVAVSIGYTAQSYAAFRNCEKFAIHVLQEDQLELARRFASRTPDKFAGLEFDATASDVPVLPGCHARFECRNFQTIDLGDHVMLVGEVYDSELADMTPLIFHRGKFVTLSPVKDVDLGDETARVRVGWLLENANGEILLEQTADSKWALPSRVVSPNALEARDSESVAVAGITASYEERLLYSIFPIGPGDRMELVYRAHATDVPEGGSIRAFALEDLPLQNLQRKEEASVFDRFRRERVLGRYGIYAPDSAGGQVAQILHNGRR